MDATGERINEAKAKPLEQLKRSDDFVAQSTARAKQIEAKGLEFLNNFVAKLPEQQNQIDTTKAQGDKFPLQQYFKTLEDIEKCAQAMRQARHNRLTR